MRSIIRIASILLTVFASVFGVMLIEVDQRDFPLQSTRNFRLDFSRATVSKAEAIAKLDEIADANGAFLAKSVADTQDFLHGRNLYAFGTKVTERQIDWFKPSLRGSVKPSSELGQASLTGSYHMSECASCQAELSDWAQASGVAMSDWRVRTPVRTFFEYLGRLGSSLALVGAFLLLISGAIAWYSSRARARMLRLLGGVKPRRIQADELIDVGRTACGWGLATLAVAAAFVAATRGTHAIIPFLSFAGAITAATLLIFLAFCALVAHSTEPTVEEIASRRPPLRGFRRLGMVAQVVALAVSAVVVPGTFISMSNASEAASRAERWAGARDAVALRIGGSDDDEVLAGQYPGIERMLADAQSQGILGFSYNVNSAVAESKANLAPYDSVIVANPTFLRLMGVQSSLKAVSAADVPDGLRQDIESNLELWRKDGAASLNGIALATTSGRATVPSINGQDGSLAYAKKPLILVVDDPVAMFSTQALLYPSLTSGNIFFTKAEPLVALIERSGVGDMVVSVDRLADVALDWAQQMREEVRDHFVALMLVAGVIVMTSIQSAQAWARLRQKRIFALHSAGRSYWSICARRLIGDVGLSGLVIAVSLLCSPIITRAPLAQSLWVLPVGLAAYAICAMCAYRLAAPAAFARSLHRR